MKNKNAEPLLEKQLFIKRSNISAAGKGLFTKKFIPEGSRIIEYTGIITTWKKIIHAEEQTGIFNAYVYYVNRNYVIDAMHSTSYAKYPNDAEGLKKIKGITNNSRFVREGLRIFMEASTDIAAGAEILISYGNNYWKKRL